MVMDRHEDHFTDEEDRRREEQERRDRQLDKAPIIIIEPKGDSHIPPYVAARQDRFYRRLLGLPPRRDA